MLEKIFLMSKTLFDVKTLSLDFLFSLTLRQCGSVFEILQHGVQLLHLPLAQERSEPTQDGQNRTG